MNEKFRKIAEELLSRDLNSKSKELPSSHSLELERRDEELVELRAQMKHVQTENERIKKRLQNEEEIQRTIEMTDHDLVSTLTMQCFSLYHNKHVNFTRNLLFFNSNGHDTHEKPALL